MARNGMRTSKMGGSVQDSRSGSERIEAKPRSEVRKLEERTRLGTVGVQAENETTRSRKPDGMPPVVEVKQSAGMRNRRG